MFGLGGNDELRADPDFTRTRLLHKASQIDTGLDSYFKIHLQIRKFREWAMLGSNQRPLPCEGSTIVCLEFLENAKCLQMYRFLALTHFPAFHEIYSGCCTVAAQRLRLASAQTPG
jgi:hypothetical protein